MKLVVIDLHPVCDSLRWHMFSWRMVNCSFPSVVCNVEMHKFRDFAYTVPSFMIPYISVFSLSPHYDTLSVTYPCVMCFLIVVVCVFLPALFKLCFFILQLKYGVGL